MRKINFEIWGEKSDTIGSALLPRGLCGSTQSMMLYRFKEPDLKKSFEASSWNDATVEMLKHILSTTGKVKNEN